jgi:hypothetical protein
MTLNISLTPEAEAKLRRQAAAAGKDVAAFVLDAVQEKLASVSPSNESATHDEWSARFHAWAESFPARSGLADDSRESIYAGRGE